MHDKPDQRQRDLSAMGVPGQQQSRAASILRDEGQTMRQEIAQVIVALQFGDRVNQILAHACDSLRALADELERGGGEGFMDRLASGYTTDEQRRLHNGEQAADASSEGDMEITFF